jgi:hypothetical protein
MNNTPKWIDIDVVGEVTKQKLFGRFCLKPYLTHGERADAVRLSETMFRGINETVDQRKFMSILAFLSLHITETDAKWWTNNGIDLFDESPVYAIVAKLAEIQDPDFGKAKVEEQV